MVAVRVIRVWIGRSLRWAFRGLSVLAFGAVLALYPISYRCTLVYSCYLSFDIMVSDGLVTTKGPDLSRPTHRNYDGGFMILPKRDGLYWSRSTHEWPLWFWLLPAFVVGAFAWVPGLFRTTWPELARARYPAGHCAGCGYDLRGLPDGRTCPECGKL